MIHKVLPSQSSSHRGFEPLVIAAITLIASTLFLLLTPDEIQARWSHATINSDQGSDIKGQLALPTVTLQTSTLRITEGSSDLDYSLSFTPAPASDIEVKILARQVGSWLPSAWRDEVALTIAAGTETYAFTIDILNDSQIESDGTVTTRIVADPDNYVLGVPNWQTNYITDDDEPITVAYADDGDVAVNEGDGTATVNLKITVDDKKMPGTFDSTDDEGNPVVFEGLVFAGSIVARTANINDYGGFSRTFTLPRGSFVEDEDGVYVANFPIEVEIVDDALDEGESETFELELELSPGAGNVTLPTDRKTIVIEDDDEAQLVLVANVAELTEGQSGRVWGTLRGGVLFGQQETIDVRVVSDSATSADYFLQPTELVFEEGADASSDGLSIYALEDDIAEEQETLGFELVRGETVIASSRRITINDATPVNLVSAVAFDTSLILTYDQELSTTATPSTAAFAVSVDGSVNTVSGVNVNGKRVILTLSDPVVSGETVTVSYTPPGDATDIQSIGNVKAAGLTDHAVENLMVGHPVVSISSALNSVTEGSSDLNYVLTFSPLPEDDVEIKIRATQVGSWIDSEWLSDVVVPIESGTYTHNITIDVINDAVNEPDGSVTLAIVADDDNYTLGTTSSITTSIVDDDAAITVTYADVGDVTVQEGSGTAAVNLEIIVEDNQTPGTYEWTDEDDVVTVYEGFPFSVTKDSGTATTPDDFEISSPTVHLPVDVFVHDPDEPGGDGTGFYKATYSVEVEIVNDTLDEGDSESLVLALETVEGTSGITLPTDTRTIVIEDDDEVQLTLVLNVTELAEGETGIIWGTLEDGVAFSQDETIAVQVQSDSATSADYSLQPTELVFEAGKSISNNRLRISTLVDDVAEEPETLTFSAVLDGTTISSGLVVQINDATPVNLVSAMAIDTTLTLTYDQELSETSVPNVASFAVSVDQVANTVTGVSVAGKTVTLTLAVAVQPGQTVTLSYTPPGDDTEIQSIGNVLAGGLTDHPVATAMVEQAVVTIQSIADSVTEGTSDLNYRLSFSPAPTEDIELKVRATQNGSWIGSEWLSDVALSITSGTTTHEFTVEVVNDAVVETDGSVTMALVADVDNYSLGSDSSVTTSVVDDDAPITVTYADDEDVTVQEGSGTATVRLTITVDDNQMPGTYVIVDELGDEVVYEGMRFSASTVSGTATFSDDYGTVNAFISLPEGSFVMESNGVYTATHAVEVGIVDDALDERASESFEMTLEAVAGMHDVTLPADNKTIVIEDDDTAQIKLVANPAVELAEGASGFVHAELEGNVVFGQDESLSIATSPVTASLTDFDTGSGPLLINAGAKLSSNGLRVSATEDEEIEATETFDVTATLVGTQITATIRLSIIDTTAPLVDEAVIDAATLIVSFTQELDEAAVPENAAFAVEVDGASVEVSDVVVAGTDVTLSLADRVDAGQTVTLSYDPPGDATDLRNTEGHLVVAIADHAVENETANRLPTFGDEDGVRSIDENLPAGTLVGDPVVATDDDASQSIEYSLEGMDAVHFTIHPTDGQIVTVAPFDFEERAAYSVVVKANDGQEGFAELVVDVSVINRDEPGEITLLMNPPEVGTTIIAELSDPDGVENITSWQWFRGLTRDGEFMPIEGEDTDRYTPVLIDIDRYLMIRTKYEDGFGPGKRAEMQTSTQVVPDPNAPTACELSDEPASTDTGHSLQPGGSVTYEFCSDTDDDWIAMELSAGQAYRIEVSWVGDIDRGWSNPYIAGMRDSNGELITGTHSFNGHWRSFANTTGEIVFRAIQNATYYVEVKPAPCCAWAVVAVPGEYEVTLEEADAPPDDVTSVQDLQLAFSRKGSKEVWHAGTVETHGDRDTYRIAIVGGHSYRFTMRSGSGIFNCIHGVANAEAPNEMLQGSRECAHEGDMKVTRRLGSLSDGYYLVTVGSDDGTGSYELHIRDLDAIPPTVYDTDLPATDIASDTSTEGVVHVNDSWVDGTDVRGEIELAKDTDWYRIELEAGRRYQIDLRGSNTGLGTIDDPYLWLYDADGNRIEDSFDDDGGFGLEALLNYTPPLGGTYYIAVAASGYEIGTYSLSVFER